MRDQPTQDQVCGQCRHYEPSRTDAKYGYCALHEQVERDKRNGVAGRMVDISTQCILVRWDGQRDVPAFSAKATP